MNFNSFTIPRKPKYAAKIPHPVVEPPTATDAEGTVPDNQPIPKKKRSSSSTKKKRRHHDNVGDNVLPSNSTKRPKKSGIRDKRKVAQVYQKIKSGRTVGYPITVTQGAAQHDAILLNCKENPEQYLENIARDERVKIRWLHAGWNDYVAVQSIQLKQIDAAPPTRQAAANSGLLLQSSDGGMLTRDDDLQEDEDGGNNKDENYFDQEDPDEPLVCYTKKNSVGGGGSSGSSAIPPKRQSVATKTEDIETDDDTPKSRTARRASDDLSLGEVEGEFTEFGAKTEAIDTDDEGMAPRYSKDTEKRIPDQVESGAAVKTDYDYDTNTDARDKEDLACISSPSTSSGNREPMGTKTEDIETDEDDVPKSTTARRASDDSSVEEGEITEVGAKTEEIDTDDEGIIPRYKKDTHNRTPDQVESGAAAETVYDYDTEMSIFSAFSSSENGKVMAIKTEDTETDDDDDDISKSRTARRASDDSSLEEGEIIEIDVKTHRGPKFTSSPWFTRGHSADELIQIAYGNLRQLRHKALASFWNFILNQVWTEQVVSLTTEPRLVRIFQHTMDMLGSFSPKDLTYTVYSMFKLIYALRERKGNSRWERILRALLLDRDKQPKRQIYNSFSNAVLDQLNHGPKQFEAQDFSNLVWSYATLGMSHDDLFEKVAKEIVSCNLDSFKSQALSNILWAYATLGKHHPILFAEIANHITRNPLVDFAPQELSQTLWAYSKCGALDRKLFEKMATHISQLDLTKWKPQELSTVMWAYTNAEIKGQKVVTLFEKLADHIAGLQSMVKFAPQAISNILWACASCKVYHRGLFKRVAEHLVEPSVLKPFRGEPIALTNILWAYGKLYLELKCQEKEEFQKLFHEIECLLLGFDNFNRFHVFHLCKIVVAYAHAGINCPRLFHKISLACIQRRGKFGARAISNTLWAFAYMNVIERELFLSFLPSVIKKLDSFNITDLVTVAWAYAVADIDAPNLFNQRFLDAVKRAKNKDHLMQLHQWHLWQTREKSQTGLPESLQERCRQVFISKARKSKFQQSILTALSSIGLESKETILESGYRIDALVKVNGRTIGLEVNGPIYFIGKTRSLLGNTILKRRQIAAVDNIDHISVPYWEWYKLGNDPTKIRRHLLRILGLHRQKKGEEGERIQE